MNWGDLPVFLAVARARSARVAAAELGISQPTVGRRIRALETSLGARLFDRVPDGHQLTARGEALVPMAEAVENAANEIGRRRDELADEASGTVRIALDEWTAHFVASRLMELREALPRVSIELHVTHNFANLSRREADLALWDTLPPPGPLLSKRIGSIAYAAYAETGYVERHPHARRASRTERCDWVGWDDEHAHFHTMVWMAERVPADRCWVRVSNAPTLYDVVRAGGGVGILPCFAADLDPALVRLGSPIADLLAPVWRLVHPDLRDRAAVRAACDAIEQLFAGDARDLAGSRRPTARARS